MVNRFRKLLLLFLLPWLAKAQPGVIAQNWKNDKELSGASYAWYVADIRTQSVLSEYNPRQLMVPASTLKIISTAAALKLLGPDYRFETSLACTGSFNKKTGVIEGDLVITGSGDPSLQSEYSENETTLETWAKTLKLKGVSEIKGQVIGDASFFDREINAEWIWGDIGNYFGAPACGLSYIDNKFTLYFQSGAVGSEARLTEKYPVYASRNFTIQSSVMANGSSDEAYVYGDPFSYYKEVKGTIPPNKNRYGIDAALPDPALLCAEQFRAALAKEGIVCRGEAESNYKKEERKKLAETLHIHYSPPLQKIVYFTNLKSNNLYCESILRAIGKGKFKDGVEAIKKFCSDLKLDTGDLYMADACGLSRANLVTVSFMTKFLLACSRDTSLVKLLKWSFPVAGKSGSMMSIGKGSILENNMCAKTGYIGRVRAYSGFVNTRSGKPVAFTVILNNFTCSPREAKLKIEKLLLAIAEL